MRKNFSVFILILALVSCYRTVPDPEYNMSLVLGPDSMVSLLTDIHLADGVINTMKDRKQPTGNLANEYFDAVLRKHQIDSVKFGESMRYYAYHTEELDKIYDRVIINLSKLESLSIPKKDSLKKLP